MFYFYIGTSSWKTFFKLRPLFSTKKVPNFAMDDKPETRKDMIVSLPLYKRLVGETGSVSDFRFKYLYIKLKDPYDKDTIKKIKSAIYSTYSDHLEEDPYLDLTVN